MVQSNYGEFVSSRRGHDWDRAWGYGHSSSILLRRADCRVAGMWTEGRESWPRCPRLRSEGSGKVYGDVGDGDSVADGAQMEGEGKGGSVGKGACMEEGAEV